MICDREILVNIFLFSGDLTYKNNRIKFKIRKKYITIKKKI